MSTYTVGQKVIVLDNGDKQTGTIKKIGYLISFDGKTKWISKENLDIYQLTNEEFANNNSLTLVPNNNIERNNNSNTGTVVPNNYPNNASLNNNNSGSDPGSVRKTVELGGRRLRKKRKTRKAKKSRRYSRRR